jgi:hypothetical protein
MADSAEGGRSHLLAAADEYDAEARILADAAKGVPLCTDPPEARLRMADRSVREGLANVIPLAKARDEVAIMQIAKALAAQGSHGE